MSLAAEACVERDSDRVYERLCRMGLLCGAILHWVTAAFLVWPDTTSATWNYSPRLVSRIAEVIVGLQHWL